MWFRKDYVGLPRTLIRRKWFSGSHLDGRARDLGGVYWRGATRDGERDDTPEQCVRISHLSERGLNRRPPYILKWREWLRARHRRRVLQAREANMPFV